MGNFQLARIFFFAHCWCRNFFSRDPLCTNFFFQTNIAFFWTAKSWFIIYVFALYKLFYTHNRSKDTAHFNAKSFRKCTHSERGRRLSGACFQSLSSGIPLLHSWINVTEESIWTTVVFLALFLSSLCSAWSILPSANFILSLWVSHLEVEEAGLFHAY